MDLTQWGRRDVWNGMESKRDNSPLALPRGTTTVPCSPLPPRSGRVQLLLIIHSWQRGGIRAEIHRLSLLSLLLFPLHRDGMRVLSLCWSSWMWFRVMLVRSSQGTERNPETHTEASRTSTGMRRARGCGHTSRGGCAVLNCLRRRLIYNRKHPRSGHLPLHSPRLPHPSVSLSGITSTPHFPVGPLLPLPPPPLSLSHQIRPPSHDFSLKWGHRSSGVAHQIVIIQCLWSAHK